MMNFLKDIKAYLIVKVMKYVLDRSRDWEYGYSAALAWIYFAIIGACLALITVVVNKFVFYEND